MEDGWVACYCAVDVDCYFHGVLRFLFSMVLGCACGSDMQYRERCVGCAIGRVVRCVHYSRYVATISPLMNVIMSVMAIVILVMCTNSSQTSLSILVSYFNVNGPLMRTGPFMALCTLSMKWFGAPILVAILSWNSCASSAVSIVRVMVYGANCCWWFVQGSILYFIDGVPGWLWLPSVCCGG